VVVDVDRRGDHEPFRCVHARTSIARLAHVPGGIRLRWRTAS
jgi:hypothetical protein